MAILNVNPTRMELRRLRRRYAVASRGHKLLKDKQDELVRRFIILIRKNEKLRIEVESELINSFKDFTTASAISVPNFLELALSLPKQRVYVDVKVNNIMSVNIPEMEFIKKNVVDLGDERQSSSIYP